MNNQATGFNPAEADERRGTDHRRPEESLQSVEQESGPFELTCIMASLGRRSPEAAFIGPFPGHGRLHHIETQQENGHRSTWKRSCHPDARPQSPALPWHKEYSQLDPKCGRVLVIDFIRADQSQNRKRKVVAQELDGLDGLRMLYRDTRRGADANLRLLHVQNAPWATKFLLRKFNIDGRDDLVGSDFGRYAKSSKAERRGGKPFPNAKTWRVQHDPWRGISKTSFGFEYLKEYRVRDPAAEGQPGDEKMMELNEYDDEDNPAYGYDVHVQRLACYVQHKEDPPSPPFDGANGISNPYKVEPNGFALAKKHKEYLPQLSSLDNENAIIIFENSQSGSFEDCLIPARSEWETHWRRLPFYLAYEARDIIGNDDLLGRQCARMILDDVFRALIARWETLLDACQTHVSILEDKIYEQPADETRAPELWRNSSLWLQIEKLTTAHMAVVRDMRVRLRELVADIAIPASSSNSNSNPNADLLGSSNDDDWLEEIPGDLDRIATTVEEDLVKPTQALISLLYQSVSIRDSRLSLQIDTSMWRLSWITFIFLPLTFMVGFFGMNVDAFSNDPSMKWYFIVSVPFMLLVLAAWYIIKHILARQRQAPYQRGIYESFFHDLAVNYPVLWSRVGPRDSIIPRTRLDRWKWWLIKRWTRPERTIKAGHANADTAAPDDLSRWSKCKRHLIRKWTDDIITFKPGSTATDAQSLDYETDLEQGSALAQGLRGATEMLTVPGQPVASAALERLELLKAQPRLQQPGTVFVTVRPDNDSNNNSNNEEILAEPAPAPGVLRFLSPSMHLHLDRATSSGTSSGSNNNNNSPSRGRRPHSSGAASSVSRNSGVLVEEEDPTWIQQLAREGRGWYWRNGGQGQEQNSSTVADRRRTSSGSGSGGGSARQVFRRSIDEKVGGGGGGGGGTAEMTSTPTMRASSPLGVVTSVAGRMEERDVTAGEGVGIRTVTAEREGETEGEGGCEADSSSKSGDSEPEKAAAETAGRLNSNVNVSVMMEGGLEERKKDGEEKKKKKKEEEEEEEKEKETH